jgi:hypothetical protein
MDQQPPYKKSLSEKPVNVIEIDIQIRSAFRKYKISFNLDVRDELSLNSIKQAIQRQLGFSH